MFTIFSAIPIFLAIMVFVGSFLVREGDARRRFRYIAAGLFGLGVLFDGLAIAGLFMSNM